MEDQPSSWRRRVDILGQRPKPCAIFLDPGYDTKKVLERARKPIIFRDNHNITVT